MRRVRGSLLSAPGAHEVVELVHSSSLYLPHDLPLARERDQQLGSNRVGFWHNTGAARPPPRSRRRGSPERPQESAFAKAADEDDANRGRSRRDRPSAQFRQYQHPQSSGPGAAMRECASIVADRSYVIAYGPTVMVSMWFIRRRLHSPGRRSVVADSPKMRQHLPQARGRRARNRDDVHLQPMGIIDDEVSQNRVDVRTKLDL